jgi:hypothetical protein
MTTPVHTSAGADWVHRVVALKCVVTMCRRLVRRTWQPAMAVVLGCVGCASRIHTEEGLWDRQRRAMVDFMTECYRERADHLEDAAAIVYIASGTAEGSKVSFVEPAVYEGVLKGEDPWPRGSYCIATSLWGHARCPSRAAFFEVAILRDAQSRISFGSLAWNEAGAWGVVWVRRSR